MIDPKIEGLIRHILGFIGSGLALVGLTWDLGGLVDPLIAAVGGVIMIITIIKSWFAKEKQKEQQSVKKEEASTDTFYPKLDCDKGISKK